MEIYVTCGDILKIFVIMLSLLNLCLNSLGFITGYKSKAQAGVAFLIAPHVNLVETMFQMSGRIISICAVAKGLRLSLINGFAPHNELTETSKTLFYRELRKA